MALPYGVGTMTGGLPFGVGSIMTSGAYGGGMANQKDIALLIDSELLNPEEFAALPAKLRAPFGNYRLYASAWQMKRKGKKEAQAAYKTARSGEDVIPSPSSGTGKARRASSGGERAVVSAKPRVSIGLGGERTRIPETGTGRDLSGDFTFRIPEEETAWKQSELQRKYNEAMFVPRLRQTAEQEATGMAKTHRELETEQREIDADLDATIERLLKSKDLKEVAEGRRLKKERESIEQKEKDRELKVQRDEARFAQQDKNIIKRFELGVDAMKVRAALQRELEGLRQENRIDYLDQTFANKLKQMSIEKDSKIAAEHYLAAVFSADLRRKAAVKSAELQRKGAMLTGNRELKLDADRKIDEANEIYATNRQLALSLLEGQKSPEGTAPPIAKAPSPPIAQRAVPGYYSINGKLYRATTVEHAKEMIAKGGKLVGYKM